LTARSLVLYGTSACHLCDVAESILLPWVVSGTQVELVDVSAQDALVAQFGARIPVLQREDGSCLYWPFDVSRVEQFLSNVVIS
jgi:hypothetical protein